LKGKAMPTIEVSHETYDKIKNQLTQDEQVDIKEYDDLIGHQWFFRTVTYHCVGRVVARVGDFLKMYDASWVAHSGRFMQAIKQGRLNEVEPVGIYYVNLKTVIDFFPWTHNLPKEQQ